MGGLNFSNEENILKYLHNGDTIYDVEIPEDAYSRPKYNELNNDYDKNKDDAFELTL